jgi:hypothetical protein
MIFKRCNLSAAEKRKRDGNSGRQIGRNNQKERQKKNIVTGREREMFREK